MRLRSTQLIYFDCRRFAICSRLLGLVSYYFFSSSIFFQVIKLDFMIELSQHSTRRSGVMRQSSQANQKYCKSLYTQMSSHSEVIGSSQGQWPCCCRYGPICHTQFSHAMNTMNVNVVMDNRCRTPVSRDKHFRSNPTFYIYFFFVLLSYPTSNAGLAEAISTSG